MQIPNAILRIQKRFHLIQFNFWNLKFYESVSNIDVIFWKLYQNFHWNILQTSNAILRSQRGFRLFHFNFWNFNFYESFPNIGGIYYENSIKIPMEYFTILRSQKWIHLNSFQFLDFQILRIAFEYCRNIWKTPEQQNKLLFFLPLRKRLTHIYPPLWTIYIYIESKFGWRENYQKKRKTIYKNKYKYIHININILNKNHCVKWTY